ncbi:MAG: hypothetical protein ACI4MI_04620 [Christensenellales bacterium]
MKIDDKLKEKIVSEVKADWERRRQERKPLELQWRLNMNFVAGNQYCEITPRGDVEDYGKQYFWQEREVFNHIASIVETRVAKLARTKVGMTVRPFSQDEGDVNSAKLSTQIVSATLAQNDMTNLMNTAITWSEVVGSCFFKTIWSADKGRVIGRTKNDAMIREGDVEIAVVPPYEIYPDSIARNSIDECLSIIHAKAYNVGEIKDAWGVEVKGDDVDVLGMDNTPSLGGAGYSASVGSIFNTQAHDSCVVIERYTLPTKEMPQGELVIVAGDELLFKGDLPYVNGRDGNRGYPFSKIHCIEKIASFFGTSVVERMIPLQRAYNAVKNRKHEYMNRIAMGVLAVEDGSVDTDNLEEEGLSPGKILVYRQGSSVPKMMDSGKVPSDFHIEEERLLSEFMSISGVSELSKYSQAYDNMSGKAISLLVEQDDTRLTISSSSIRECVKRIAEQIIRLYKQFATCKRLVRISGDNSEVKSVYFSKSDLDSEDIVFDNENQLSDSLANRRNMVMELIKLGALNDSDGSVSKRNKLKILEMLGLGNWESSLDIEDCHRNKALKENMEVESKELEVGEFDDHRIHCDEHIKRFIGSEDVSAKVKERLRKHIREHQSKLIETQALAQIETSGA